MPVVEDDDMLEHVVPNAADDSLAVGMLPGTARGSFDCFDTHVLDALLERPIVDRVPVPEEIARRSLPGKRLDDVLGGPLRRGMFSDVEMYDASALVRQHDEHKQDLEAGSGNGKEITRHQVSDMVMEKGFPRG